MLGGTQKQKGWEPLVLTVTTIHSTYTRVFNLGQNIESKMMIRLIRGSTYTRVYTVI
jgi:hypothetical protein